MTTLVLAGLIVAACGDDTGTGASTQGGGGEGAGVTGGGGNGTGGDTAGGPQGGGGGTQGECGDGVIDQGETCDDGNTNGGDGCNAQCAVELGFECDGEPSVCAATCGDGIVAGDEACDDGNGDAGDGCDGSCTVEPGYDCTGAPSTCVTDCGDGVIAGDEACDDGNDVSNDGCDMLCAEEHGYTCIGEPSDCSSTCGDGLIADGAEECDDAGTTDGDGCSATCTIETGWSCDMEPSECTTDCGDGAVAGVEGCDDGNLVDGDGCSAACAEEQGYSCTGSPSTCTATCGDGIQAASEQCDDNNNTDGDCCTSTCTVEAGCETEPNNDIATADDFATTQVGGVVHGFVNPTGDANYYAVTLAVPGSIRAETLDGILGTTCVSNDIDSRIRIMDSTGTVLLSDDDSGAGYCSLATSGLLTAGTYYVVVDASTLAAIDTFDYTVQVTVNPAVCGDGDVDPGEQCDDGNLVSGDGCSSACQAECPGVTESEPNDTSATADAIPANNIQNCASINPLGDDDFYSFTLTGVSDVTIETSDATGAFTGCIGTNSVDTNMFLLATDGTTQLANNDDIDVSTNRCSRIVRTGMPAGTYFVRVIEFNEDALIAGYRVKVRLDAQCGNGTVEGAEECDGGAGCNPDCTRVPVCGDHFIDAPELCDDGNTVSGDGCSSTCQLENILAESEPNDDGATAINTNDFSAANADGPITSTTIVTGSIGVAGDDDVFAVSNPTGAPIVFTAEVFTNLALTQCTSITTQINIRDAAGTSLAQSTDEGIGSCSHLSWELPAGQTVYVHLIELGDNAAIASYFLHINYLSPIQQSNETEPNEDGTPQTGGIGIAGNDFDAGGIAVANATAQGVITADRLYTAAIGAAGDEDVYAITNSGATAVTFDAETFVPTVGLCTTGMDTGMTIRNAAGASVASSDDDGIGACSYLDNVPLAAGQTLYVHVVEYGDNAAIPAYKLLVTVN